MLRLHQILQHLVCYFLGKYLLHEGCIRLMVKIIGFKSSLAIIFQIIIFQRKQLWPPLEAYNIAEDGLDRIASVRWWIASPRFP